MPRVRRGQHLRVSDSILQPRISGWLVLSGEEESRSFSPSPPLSPPPKRAPVRIPQSGVLEVRRTTHKGAQQKDAEQVPDATGSEGLPRGSDGYQGSRAQRS